MIIVVINNITLNDRRIRNKKKSCFFTLYLKALMSPESLDLL